MHSRQNAGIPTPGIPLQLSQAWLWLGNLTLVTPEIVDALLRAVMSRIAAVTRIPSALSSGLSMISIGNSLPSFRRPVSSIPAPICCARASSADRRVSAIRRSAKPSRMRFVTV
jgi:hypothetical protein